MPREQIQSISIATILSFSRALIYSLSPCNQRYARFEVVIVDSVELIVLKWRLRGYQSLIVDPYTATRTENSTRNKRDPLRINSLENGVLLCLTHHKAYDTFRFSIHPTVLPYLF